MELIVDAGPKSVSVILAQPQPKKTNVVACASRTSSNKEKRYSQIEKDMVGVVWGVQHF